VFDPWKQTIFDEADTVAQGPTETGDPRTDADIGGYVADFFKIQPNTWRTWYQQRSGGGKGQEEKTAAEKAAKHAETPTTSHLDSLGRPFLSFAHNGFRADGTAILFPTRTELDIEGNEREVRDAVAQNGDPGGRVVVRYEYDMLGNRIAQHSMEAGSRWMLNDCTGKPICAWDSRGHDLRSEYDALRRPIQTFVVGADQARPGAEMLTERLVYGEQHPQDEQRNLRNKLFLRLDQAGLLSTEEYDFKGNPLRGTRRLASMYDRAIGWDAADGAIPDAPTKLTLASLGNAVAPDLETETFTSRIRYDALNRPIQAVAPHSDQWGAERHVIQSGYGESGLLESVDVWLDRPSEPTDLLDPAVTAPSRVGVTNIDYDAKGRRVRVEYKNGAVSNLAYDPETFRLVKLYTTRGAGFTGDCENTNPPPATVAAPDVTSDVVSCGVQNLHYTYDPVGNIVRIRDDAQQTIYFRNKRVEPNGDYTYDAMYRLVEATGREHLGQVGGSPIPHSYNDAPRVGIDWSANDGNVMGTYTERYIYDAVGNVSSMEHVSESGQPAWNRAYSYLEQSLLEPAKRNNRLSSTTVGGSAPVTDTYLYDEHGNVRRMPHLWNPANPQTPNMHWNHKDQLRQVDLGGGGTVYYTYDGSGQRVRKVWEKSTSLIDERIYLSGFEIFRRRNRGTVTRERETLRVTAGEDCVALVESRRLPTGPDPNDQLRIIRYQFGNHLGSAVLELDDQALIISTRSTRHSEALRIRP
jgi:YD repeat-containing protein